MAESILAIKRLDDGADLRLIRYEASSVCGRPEGSLEMVLLIDNVPGPLICGGATDPRASWFFTECQYREMFDIVKSSKDFGNLYQILDTLAQASRDLDSFTKIKKSSKLDDTDKFILAQLAAKYNHPFV